MDVLALFKFERKTVSTLSHFCSEMSSGLLLVYSDKYYNCIIKDFQIFSLHKRPYPTPDSFSELLSKL